MSAGKSGPESLARSMRGGRGGGAQEAGLGRSGRCEPGLFSKYSQLALVKTMVSLAVTWNLS